MGTIVGDVLISAAFLAYGGLFDQHYRGVMRQEWVDHLAAAGISFKPELALSEFLSSADERLQWQSNALPADNLCIENAIMLKRFNRYPLIIDPTGQATTFLQNAYRDRKITVTSFLDESFLKNLESSIRFGTPLLIQDVEHLDPILNPVLNRELRRTGGRVLLRIGNQDIDFSPAFALFLSTRDPSVEFAPDICSRVTYVNFTMTRSSLQTQALDKVLKVERPEVDRKRTDMIKLQGEFRLRLRHLEKSLLQALNDSTGSILDDDNVIATLEVLKKEAAEVTQKVQDTEAVMSEVGMVTSEYMPLAQACSSIYFTLEQLANIHHFYQFSLDYFLEIFDNVLLLNTNLNGVSNHAERKAILLRDLFLQAYRRVSRTLLHSDHLVLAISLAKLRLDGRAAEEISDELDAMMEVPSGTLDLDAQQLKVLSSLGGDVVQGLQSSLAGEREKWSSYLSNAEPEKAVPWTGGAIDGMLLSQSWLIPGVSKSARSLLVTKLFRPDRLIQAADAFASSTFGADLADQADFALQTVVQKEVSATHPVAFASVPGYDASYRVDALCKSTGIACTSVALGSAEGFGLADQAIANAARTGTWVLLKNVHLAPTWLGQLEKRLHSLSAAPTFRLFLTMETNPKVPVNILRQSRIIMNEPPPGVRANLLDTLKSIRPARLASGPAEKPRLYFLLAWFHAVVQERLRYLPLGWSKAYEFNDSDLDAALDTIDAWLGDLAKGKANIDPAQIPWIAVRTLVKQAVYGGRIDSDFDQRVLDAFVDRIFSPRAYDPGFVLVHSSSGNLTAPEGTQISQFIEWAHALPERELPAWLGLPDSAESLVATAEGAALLGKLRKMRSTDDDDETVGSAASTIEARPAWMSSLKAQVAEWLSILPEGVSAATIEDSPLSRFFAREASTGRSLLAKIRLDLGTIVQVCNGSLKQTNESRALISDLNKGDLPISWRKFKMPRGSSTSAFITSFVARLTQIERIAGGSAASGIWLGGLFQPEAYITATRQAVAQAKGWSLEQLILQLEVEEQVAEGVGLDGLKLEGATWEQGGLQLNKGDSTTLKTSSLVWRKKDLSAAQTDGFVNIPVYLNSDRTDVLFSVDLDSAGCDQAESAQRGICIITL